jgi:membrane protein DedA with SNARE-associated domain
VLFSARTFTDLLDAYGYAALAVGVAIESSGIPFPGETFLVVAGTYAGRTGHLELRWIIAAAASGAIVGDNLGFVVGRRGGVALARRYGRRIGLDERRLRLGVWLFRRYGALVVFFGRFISVLRAWAAFLAGTNRMPWGRFLVANASGGVVWAAVVGGLAYTFGDAVSRVAGAVGWAALVVVVIAVVAGARFLKRHEQRLLDEAERALPGPLEGEAP